MASLILSCNKNRLDCWKPYSSVSELHGEGICVTLRQKMTTRYDANLHDQIGDLDVLRTLSSLLSDGG